MTKQCLTVRGAETVAAGLVDDAHVYMQAAAGFGHERLRHKRGFHAERARHALDQTLEKHGLVRRSNRVGDMPQVDLILADTVLRHGATHRQLLSGRRIVYATEKNRHVFDGFEREVGRAARCCAARRRAKRDAAIGGASRVYQVELELAGHDRMESCGAALSHDLEQDHAWVKPQLLALDRIHHVADHLRRRRRRPRHAL